MTDSAVLNLGCFEQAVMIFGGPYGNLQATQALLQVATELKLPPTQVICNGDCVAYCGQPAETVKLIREWGIPVVMGNCEESLATGREDCGCGFESGSRCSVLAESWYPYCSEQLNEADKAWMGTLPKAIQFTMNGHSFHLVHGAVSAINRFVFASSPADIKRHELSLAGTDVLIGGHAGIPFAEKLENRYWLNSGVIGMPANDGTRDGWYLLLIPNEDSVKCQWHRLKTDYRQTRQVMKRAGLDNGYCQALESGLWPSMDVLPESEREQQGRAITLQPLSL
ncbi:MAG: metallophosphoesterase family protein [Candidatus Thiodiazotropha weberae]|nr:metallophosphoesterase family protein [Candidatus Thiodiazotropha lotti]MCG7986552.1 metallophosphoesterase family protein [Candidatus Thiodiazotropha lotti]MCG8010481.1 metallophosphoesterase family protein [Candidatus Thiodiazotropha lotti]MCG8021438.1 metallophosphoesterase family protein [Candidatus Thiodiazotropha lotti]MCW4208605.1 metallophosphoesterase family protein [Candidatus Thiodiazotropha lotti]